MVNPAAFKPRKQNSHRADETKRCQPYRKWLNGRPCFIAVHTGTDADCRGDVRACHFDPWGDKGMGTKVSDNACMPMCDGHHGEQHSGKVGWPRFQAKYKFDGRHVVTAYWLQWLNETPMGAAWQAKQGDADESPRSSPSVRRLGGPR